MAARDDELLDLDPPAAGRRRRPLRAARRLLVLLLVVGAVAAGGWWATRTILGSMQSPVCQFAAGTTEELDPEQAGNAALIAAIATRRSLPPRAVTIALATALQESKLRNIRYGDQDSVGLFQQRPSQGWGTEAQILDAGYATNAFYDALVKVRDWQTRDITEVAQAVQRSAYPDAYRRHEQRARSIASSLTGQAVASTTCRLEPPRELTSAAGVRAELVDQLGVAARTDGNTVVVEASGALGWQVAHWAVARADVYGVTSVSLAGVRWQRSNDASALQWPRTAAANTAGGSSIVITLGPTGS